MEYYDPRDYDLAGRIAKLKTLHGVIETPYLFPVIDPVKQVPSLNTILEIGFNAFITNAYLFYRRNRGIVKNIHEYFSWNNPIMTDSGGYQILVYGSVDIDNKTIVEYEKEIGTDIGVILDIPTGTRMSWKEAWNALIETYRRAWEALPYIMDSEQLWVYPIQGAPYPDLVKYSSITAQRIPYHIYALGSPTVFLEKYEYENILLMTLIARQYLPPNKPLHVFGVGHPMIIPYLVAVGADLFDSASYILYARDNRLLFEWGTKHLNELFYLPCSCPVCSKYSVEELREMDRRERTKLIAIHNLYVLYNEIKRVKQAIKEGRLWEYLETKSRSHPRLRRIFEILKKHRKYLTLYNPYTKAPVQALFILDTESIYNPRLETNKERVYKNMVRRYKGKKLLLIPAIEKPFTEQELYVKYSNKYKEHYILFYHPYLGIFPPTLTDTYPYFQHEIGIYEYNEKIIKEIVDFIRELEPDEIVLVTHNTTDHRLIKELTEIFKEKLEIIHASNNLESRV